MEGVEFRRFQDGDERAVNDGFNLVFAQRRPLAEWHWKFRDEEERRFIMLAWGDDGQLLVHYGAVPVRVQVGDRVFQAGQIVDVYSRLEARRGLAAARTFVANYDRFVETFCGPDALALCYGFPGDRALRLGVRRTSYDDITPWPIARLRRPTARRARLAPGWDVREGFDAAAAERVWARSRARYKMAVVRDADHLRRRYLGRPDVEYRHLVAWRRGAPLALAVVRLGAGTAQLADLVWDGAEPGALAALDRLVRALAVRAEATEVVAWMHNDAEATGGLQRLGWEDAGATPDLRCVVRVFHPDIDWSAVPGRFYLTLGDSDLA